MIRLTTAALVAAAVLIAPSSATAAPGGSSPTTVSAEPVGPTTSGWQPRPEEYPSTTVETDLAIPTSDGTVLLADLKRPVDAGGEVVDAPLPVVVTITAYSKTAIGSTAGAVIAGASPDYLVQRGYLQLTVDARGTGGSGGTWQVFGEREQLDAKEIVEWAAQQPWSDGSVAMSGPSYMGISQLFAAGQNPQGLKAIFPQVPTAEVYRDVVASGGQLDTGFMPLWLGLVNLTGLVPSTSPQAVENLLTHLVGNGASSIQLLLDAATGGPQAYDGEFYEARSTIDRSVPNIDVPTFLIGGEYDLFQRGTPLVYQALRERGVPVKMILGPWDHLQGSNGEGVPDAGLGTLSELQLRWFDHYVKGLPDPGLDTDLPSFTYYEIGSDTWQYRDSYLSDQTAASFKLSGTSTTLGGANGQLTQGEVVDGSSQILPIPVAGLCSRSTSQWTAGVLNLIGAWDACNRNAGLNDATGVVFETAPLTSDLNILGPLNARLYTSSTTGDGLLSVSVSRVTPDGVVDRLTGGWQVISLAELDESRSVVLDGEIIQPWHPYTQESRRVLDPGEIVPVDVEVFPTGAVVNAGERLRISVQSFDTPHLLSPLTHLAGQLGVITIHNDADHPSRLTVPTLGASGAENARAEAAVLEDVRSALASADTGIGPGPGTGTGTGYDGGEVVDSPDGDTSTSFVPGLVETAAAAGTGGSGAMPPAGVLILGTLAIGAVAIGAVTALRFRIVARGRLRP
ncbi:MAG: CocE/NonD family hydrolase [Aeromicrobium sp.]|uniref:CocE/NonD family hydrolase n=1 Tax=Aeromicrobium sp. TaxID=1871063 RepID=UPI00262E8CB2|nr:CocE/NonD family hydrolase [Aeromicrobium sp.]MDF1705225.1 CocE/NonD family hydrolase [Aeromicrobium sp.]